MVQLKVVSAKSRNYCGWRFQFLYGTIKSYFNYVLVRVPCLFQFLYGTIKRIALILLWSMIIYFNSSMVQLKATELHRSEHVQAFQFLYGTIKSCAGICDTDSFILFQFLYGTIKRAIFFTMCKSIEIHFNSSMVQLKVHWLRPKWKQYSISIPLWYN